MDDCYWGGFSFALLIRLQDRVTFIFFYILHIPVSFPTSSVSEAARKMNIFFHVVNHLYVVGRIAIVQRTMCITFILK